MRSLPNMMAELATDPCVRKIVQRNYDEVLDLVEESAPL